MAEINGKRRASFGWLVVKGPCVELRWRVKDEEEEAVSLLVLWALQRVTKGFERDVYDGWFSESGSESESSWVALS